MAGDISEETEARPERLEWLPQPVELLRYDTVDGDERAVRIFLNLVGDEPPGYSLAEVSKSERRDCVAVTVIRRDLVGVRPDGAEYGHKLVSCLSCLHIELQSPLGDREVIDSSTGLPVTRLNRAPVFDPEQGDLDHQLAELVRTDGCPLWR